MFRILIHDYYEVLMNIFHVLILGFETLEMENFHMMFKCIELLDRII